MLITKNQIQNYVPLYTERLVLRKICMKDAPYLFEEYTSDPAVVVNASWKTHKSVKETQKFLETCLKKWELSEEFNLCICFREYVQQPIGMFKIKSVEDKVSIGYVLAKKNWNKGYATEAVKAVCNVLFHLPRVKMVEASTDSQNYQSMAVLKKAGFSYTQTLKNHIIRPQLSNLHRDSELYQLKKS